MDAISQANYTQVHTQAPIKMAESVVFYGFLFGVWFWKASLRCGPQVNAYYTDQVQYKV